MVMPTQATVVPDLARSSAAGADRVPWALRTVSVERRAAAARNLIRRDADVLDRDDRLLPLQRHPAAKRAGLPGVTLHVLRHSFASILIAMRANVKYLQGQLGHTNASRRSTCTRSSGSRPARRSGSRG